MDGGGVPGLAPEALAAVAVATSASAAAEARTILGTFIKPSLPWGTVRPRREELNGYLDDRATT